LQKPRILLWVDGQRQEIRVINNSHAANRLQPSGIAGGLRPRGFLPIRMRRSALLGVTKAIACRKSAYAFMPIPDWAQVPPPHQTNQPVRASAKTRSQKEIVLGNVFGSRGEDVYSRIRTTAMQLTEENKSPIAGYRCNDTPPWLKCSQTTATWMTPMTRTLKRADEHKTTRPKKSDPGICGAREERPQKKSYSQGIIYQNPSRPGEGSPNFFLPNPGTNWRGCYCA